MSAGDGVRVFFPSGDRGGRKKPNEKINRVMKKESAELETEQIKV